MENDKVKTWNGIPTFRWKGHDWIARPLWGELHPDDLNQWLDQSTHSINSEGNLILWLQKSSRSFLNGDTIAVPQVGRPYIRTTEEFKYGTFIWYSKIPYGEYMWPALWLASDYSWPPEIDCMEGWSNNNPKYIKRLLFKNIHPTMHWTENGEHCQEGKFNVLRCILKDQKVNKYEVIWTPKAITVKYNNILIKKYDNPKMLEHMNKPEIKMHPIISLSFQKDYFNTNDSDRYEEGEKCSDLMVVEDFKYYPYK